MKNILLSIDFSQNAYNAAIYAAELASHTGARLILFHAYNPLVLTDDEELCEDLLNTERKVQNKLDSLARKLQSLTDISITRLLKPGNVVDETLYVANKIKTDLIVIGLAKTTRQFYPVLDAFTTELAEKTTLPLLIVPPKAVFRNYEYVYLASEGPGSVHDLTNLKFLNKIFNRFRGVQLVKFKDNQGVSAAQATRQADQQGNGTMQAATSGDKNSQNNDSTAGKSKQTPAEQIQLWIYAYSTVTDFKNSINDNAITLKEAIPVLLLPVGKV